MEMRFLLLLLIPLLQACGQAYVLELSSSDFTSDSESLNIGNPSVIQARSMSHIEYIVDYPAGAAISLAASHVQFLGASAGCSATVLPIDSDSRMVRVSNCSGDGEMTLKVLSGSAVSASGALLGPSSSSQKVMIDNTAPSVSGLTSTATPMTSHTWNWSCSEANCLFRYVVNTNTVHVFVTEPWGVSSSTTITDVSGTYYLHVEAKDALGNISSVHTVSVPMILPDTWNETGLSFLDVPNLQINLAEPSKRTMAFADLSKTAEIWINAPSAISETEARSVGASLTYSADGWPTSLPPNYYITVPSLYYIVDETLASPVTNASNVVKYMRGVYVLTWKGEATVTVTPSPNLTDLSKFEILSSAANRIVFLVKSHDRYPAIRIQNINPANPLHSLRVWAPIDEGAGLSLTNASNLSIGSIAASTEPALGADEPLWHPKYIEAYQNHPAEVLRFMTWHRINDVEEVEPLEWSDHPSLHSIAPRLSVITSTYQRVAPEGTPYRFGSSAAYAISLANALNKDIWFNIPHTASDDFIKKLARFFSGQLGGTRLNNGLKIWMEFSNELWNSQESYVPQMTLAKQKAADHFGVAIGSVSHAGDMHAWGSGNVQARALKVFEDEWRLLGNSDASLVNVISGFAVNSSFNNKIILAAKEVDPLLPEAFAITTYFGGSATDELYNAHAFGADPGVWPESLYKAAEKSLARMMLETSKQWKASVDVAASYGLPLVAYEGGQHILATGKGNWSNVANRDFMRFIESLQEHEAMARLYSFGSALWSASGASMASHFLDINAFSYYGYFGLKRYLFQSNQQSSKTRSMLAWANVHTEDIRPMSLVLNSAPRFSVSSYRMEVGIASSVLVSAAGGDGFVQISLLGGSLPSGLSLTQNGVSGQATLAGAPLESGEFHVVFRAMDVDKDIHDFVVKLTVDPEGTSTQSILMFIGSNIPNSSPGGSIYSYGRYDWITQTTETLNSGAQTVQRMYVPFSESTKLFKKESLGPIVLEDDSVFQMYGGISLARGPNATFNSNSLVGLLDGGFHAWVGDSITKTTMDYFLFWKKSQFESAARGRTLSFGALGKESTLHLDLVSLAEDENKIRFVIKDGSTWYASEALFDRNFLGDGIFELSQFQNSNQIGKRWTIINPTAASFELPEGATYVAHEFTDVQAVGIMGRSSRNQWNFRFKFNRFFVLGR